LLIHNISHSNTFSKFSWKLAWIWRRAALRANYILVHSILQENMTQSFLWNKNHLQFVQKVIQHFVICTCTFGSYQRHQILPTLSILIKKATISATSLIYTLLITGKCTIWENQYSEKSRALQIVSEWMTCKQVKDSMP
jgi:hypothetical protein